MNPNTQPEQQGTGAFIGSLVIVLILLGLAGYFISNERTQQQERAVQNQKIQQENAANEATLESIETQLSVPEPDYVGGGLGTGSIGTTSGRQ